MLEDKTNEYLVDEIQSEEKHTKVAFLVTGVVIFLLIINLIYLNLVIFGKQTILKGETQRATAPPASISPTILPTPCSNCLSPTALPTTSPSIISPTAVINLQPAAKEYFIPLGTGTNQTSDWADVPGVQTTIDFSQYTNIKEIRFEASIYVPTANQFVSVRLFNVTDKHPVWNSEVTMSGNASAYLTSSPISYDLGAKLYQVQMKTQLKALANLVQAKVHIILR